MEYKEKAEKNRQRQRDIMAFTYPERYAGYSPYRPYRREKTKDDKSID